MKDYRLEYRGVVMDNHILYGHGTLTLKSGQKYVSYWKEGKTVGDQTTGEQLTKRGWVNLGPCGAPQANRYWIALQLAFDGNLKEADVNSFGRLYRENPNIHCDGLRVHPRHVHRSEPHRCQGCLRPPVRQRHGHRTRTSVSLPRSLLELNSSVGTFRMRS